MPRGENIYKRKDGRWEARYVKNYTPAGRIIFSFVIVHIVPVLILTRRDTNDFLKES